VTSKGSNALCGRDWHDPEFVSAHEVLGGRVNTLSSVWLLISR